MTADAKANGNGWVRQWGAPGIIMALLASILGMILWYARIDAHAQDCNVHHTAAQLDEAYTRRDLYDERQAAVEARLERIETKIDRLTERVSANR